MDMDQLKSDLANADPFQSWWPFILAGAVFLVSIIRAFMGGQQCPSSNNIDGLIVIVTGSSGGIGLEIVKDLCKRGAQVIMACKDMEKSENAKQLVEKLVPSAKVECRYLDLRSFDCIKRFVKSIEKDFEKIDTLINNAGITFAPYDKTVDGFETHLQTNYLGPFLLSHLLLPVLKKANQGRIINVAAHAYASGKMSIEDPLNIGTWSPAYHARDAFAHSKLAVVLGSKHFAKVLKEDTSITVNSCTPGLVRGTDHLRESPLMKALCAKVMTYPWMWLFMKNPVQGSQTPIFLASEQKLKDITGEYFNDCEKVELVEIAQDDELAEKLYKESLRAVKLNTE